MEKGQTGEVAVSEPMVSLGWGAYRIIFVIFQIFAVLKIKNEAGDCLRSHVGVSLRSLGSEERAGGARGLRAVGAGCLRRVRSLVGVGTSSGGRHGSSGVGLHCC